MSSILQLHAKSVIEIFTFHVTSADRMISKSQWTDERLMHSQSGFFAKQSSVAKRTDKTYH